MIGDTAPPLSLVAMAMPDLYVHTGSAVRSRVAPTLRSLPSASAATRAMIDGVHESLRGSGCEKQIKVSNRWINDSLQKGPVLYLLPPLQNPS